MKTDWYKDWFNTPEYLNVYRHRNETDAVKLVDLILDKIDLQPGSSVLDMACGSGRHSIRFARKGFDVSAIDLSENLLQVAKEQAEESNLKIDFIRADLRTFRLDKKFDLAINLFTSFGYFQSDDANFKVFENSYHHLKKDGYLVIDYFNKNFISENLVKKSVEEIEGNEVLQERFIEGNRVNKIISISRNGSTDEYYESVRMYSDEEIENELKRIGFDILNKFGDFEGNIFNGRLSPRLILISKK